MRLFLMLSLFGISPTAQQPVPATSLTPSAASEKLSCFAQRIEGQRREWEVPGLAVGIIHGDRVVFARGFGTRTAGRDEPVDAATTFGVGSLTKGFTAALAAMAVGDGKMRWDDPVTKHLPDFVLPDPYVTREITIRDLLTHRAGLPRADYLWHHTAYTRGEVIRRLRFVPLASPFRARFGYSNLGYLIAGDAVARAAGASWDELLRERIFIPLGMRASGTSVPARSGNTATPYGPSGEVLPWIDAANAAAAGAVTSTLSDMLSWMRLQVDGGRMGGTMLIDAAALREMRTPQQVMPLGGLSAQLTPFTRFLTYAMGWNVSDHRGRVMYSHGGNIDGMSASAAFLPDERIGVVVLSNRESSPLPVILTFQAVDALLGAPPHDWNAAYLKASEAAKAAVKAADDKRAAARIAGTRPSAPLDAYAGDYAADQYGDAKVWVESGRLRLRFGPFDGPLEHWQHDTFRAAWRPSANRMITFTVDASGRVASIDIEGVGTLRR